MECNEGISQVPNHMDNVQDNDVDNALKIHVDVDASLVVWLETLQDIVEKFSKKRLGKEK